MIFVFLIFFWWAFLQVQRIFLRYNTLSKTAFSGTINNLDIIIKNYISGSLLPILVMTGSSPVQSITVDAIFPP